MLTLERLSKSYGESIAVTDVSLEVPAGQMLGIIGRSGAGKSTLLRMLNRLIEPSSGTIAWNKVEVTSLSGSALFEWRSRCAMIFQHFNLVKRLDVVTNAMMGGVGGRPIWRNMLGSFSDDERRAAFALLEEFDMGAQALKRADGISGGQAQRVAIARALMQKPEIILADEPVASLDPRNAKVVMDALRKINRSRGITVICNLHNLHMARTYCDRVVAMVAGRVLFDCLPSELGMDRIRQVYGVDSEHDQLDPSMADFATMAT
jgi:phosphonate transport system ATP-binding protein